MTILILLENAGSTRHDYTHFFYSTPCSRAGCEGQFCFCGDGFGPGAPESPTLVTCKLWQHARVLRVSEGNVRTFRFSRECCTVKAGDSAPSVHSAHLGIVGCRHCCSCLHHRHEKLCGILWVSYSALVLHVSWRGGALIRSGCTTVGSRLFDRSHTRGVYSAEMVSSPLPITSYFAWKSSRI